MSYPPNAEHQRAEWLLIAAHWRERAELARRYDDKDGEKIFTSGAAKAEAQAEEWRARIVGGK
jgi:hypothetical protein